MGLDKLHSAGGVPSLIISAAQRACLAFRQGSVDRCRPAIGAGANAFHHSVNAVSVPFGIFEPAKRHNANAFTEHGAVGLVRERAAILRRRQSRRLGEAHIHQDVVQRVDTASENKVTVSGAQFMDGAVKGRKR